jgi:predicted hotdog family 3-hydroxylacyl-ACP dehydratase
MNRPSTPSAMNATIPPIASLLPHSASMLLLDRVVAADADRLHAEVAITPHTLFADADGVGSWIGIEYMAQAIAAFAGLHAHHAHCTHSTHTGGQTDEQPDDSNNLPKIGFLLGSRRYTANRDHFALGSNLQVHVLRLLQAENGLGSFDCFIADGEEHLASAILTVFQPPDLATFLEESAA